MTVASFQALAACILVVPLWSAIVDKIHDCTIASMFSYMTSTSRSPMFMYRSSMSTFRSLMFMYRSSMSTFRSWIAMFRSPLLTWMLAAVYYIDIHYHYRLCFHLRRSGDRMRVHDMTYPLGPCSCMHSTRYTVSHASPSYEVGNIDISDSNSKCISLQSDDSIIDTAQVSHQN